MPLASGMVCNPIVCICGFACVVCVSLSFLLVLAAARAEAGAGEETRVEVGESALIGVPLEEVLSQSRLGISIRIFAERPRAASEAGPQRRPQRRPQIQPSAPA